MKALELASYLITRNCEVGLSPSKKYNKNSSNEGHDCPWGTEMVVKALSYPSIHSLVVVFLNIIFHVFIIIQINQAIGDLVENSGRLFIAADED